MNNGSFVASYMKIRHALTLYLRPLHILSQKEKKKKKQKKKEKKKCTDWEKMVVLVYLKNPTLI